MRIIQEVLLSSRVILAASMSDTNTSSTSENVNLMNLANTLDQTLKESESITNSVTIEVYNN